MEKPGDLKSTLKVLLTEFVMVFLGVFVAFGVNDWGERQKEKEFTAKIISHITEDIRIDSINIITAIEMLQMQSNHVDTLTSYFSEGKFERANDFVRFSYTSYNAFEPSTESYQSMIYGGDLKLIEDYNLVRMLKEIDQINQQVNHIHNLYFAAVADIRNTFICKEDMTNLNLKTSSNRREFGNRLEFLKWNYLKNYVKVLIAAQAKYHSYLESVNNQPA